MGTTVGGRSCRWVMVEQQTPGSHPLVTLTRLLDRELDAVADVDPMYLPPRDQAATLVGLQQARERLAELELRVLVTADPDALAPGVKSAGRWLAHETQAVRPRVPGATRQRPPTLRRTPGRVRRRPTARPTTTPGSPTGVSAAIVGRESKFRTS